MNREGFGALLIVSAIFLVWLYNTGRLRAVFSAIINPEAPPESLLKSGEKETGGLTTKKISSKTDWKDVVACYERTQIGDYSCVGSIWTSINSPSDIINVVKSTVNDIFGWTGIKL